MRYRTFGRTGWQVSEIGFGGWAIGGGWGPQRDEESLAALHRALDLGVTFIDTAQGYGQGHSERLIGQVLRERGQRVGESDIKVATKIPPRDGHWPPFPYDDMDARYPAAYLRQGVEESLQRLEAERLDLLQLHTWTRAWNRQPAPLEALRALQKEGKIDAIGISTPEHDQNALIQLMREGWLDGVQVIYNIFEQEPAAELLPAARQHGVGVIVRVVFDEGSLTGKFTSETTFEDGDFRRSYFRGDRLAAVVKKVEAVRQTVQQLTGEQQPDMPVTALRFALQHPAVCTVIPGIRTTRQAEANVAASDLGPLDPQLYAALKEHNWRRADWYGGEGI
jgi:aryl-alcohol dehydrogenase-like predicted oxidoreductase